ncbi:prefoldin subunit [Candidatus Woesearchaeota archaeon]|nr:prefoldin subunit [Candidatus Woesearchaeota archaeon]
MQQSTKEKIMQLQTLEQRMQNLLLQKQNFQTQTLEVENALAELKNGKGETYKIIGNVMIAMKREELKKDLTNRKEILDLRVKSLEKEEEKTKSASSILQEEVMKELKKKDG